MFIHNLIDNIFSRRGVMLLSVDEFKKNFEAGNLSEAFASIIKDDVLEEKEIYELCSKLNQNEIKSMCITVLINNLLERTRNAARESAYKLLLMALRTNNEEFRHDILTSEFLRCVHQTISVWFSYNQILSKKFQDDVILLLNGWNVACSDDPKFSSLADACKILKVEGYKFPDDKMALVMNVSPPEWKNSPSCESCSAQFSTIFRKHHCRNCGSTICSKCSTITMSLPHYYIMKPVKVCTKCSHNLTEWKLKIDQIFQKDVKDAPPRQTSEDNDPDFLRAIELSLQEAKQKSSYQEKKISYPTPQLDTIIQSQPSAYSPTLSYPKIDIPIPDYASFSKPPVSEPISNEYEIIDNQSYSQTELSMQNLSRAMTNLRIKLENARTDVKSAYNNQSLHTLFQATLATYNVFVASRENNYREIEKYTQYLELVEKIIQARVTLNEARKMNSLKIMEQRKESEALLRIQMEQKMHLVQQQTLELEEYKKSLTEQRLRQFAPGSTPPQNPFRPAPQIPQMPTFHNQPIQTLPNQGIQMSQYQPIQMLPNQSSQRLNLSQDFQNQYYQQDMTSHNPPPYFSQYPDNSHFQQFYQQSMPTNKSNVQGNQLAQETIYPPKSEASGTSDSLFDDLIDLNKKTQ